MKVAIIGSAQTQYVSAQKDLNLFHVIFRTVSEALKDANISIADVNAIIQCNNDYFDGIAINNMWTAEACGGAIVQDETRVETDGMFGAVLAAAKVGSGLKDIAIVMASSNSSNVSPYYPMALATDPFYTRSFLNEITALALQARLYMEKYGITEEQAAKVSVKNKKNALKNPLALSKGEYTVDDILYGKPMAIPLTEMNTPPEPCDGTCVLVLASEEKAKNVCDHPVWINGIGYNSATHMLGAWDLTGIESARAAAQKAYQQAGITDPVKQIDVAEISDVSAFHELMLYEALGFCDAGGGGAFMDAGKTQVTGDIPVNPSGGILSGTPFMARGLARLTEAYLQLAGKAGDRQIADCEVALAHGTLGLCLQNNCVMVLGKN